MRLGGARGLLRSRQRQLFGVGILLNGLRLLYRLLSWRSGRADLYLLAERRDEALLLLGLAITIPKLLSERLDVGRRINEGLLHEPVTQ